MYALARGEVSLESFRTGILHDITSHKSSFCAAFVSCRSMDACPENHTETVLGSLKIYVADCYHRSHDVISTGLLRLIEGERDLHIKESASRVLANHMLDGVFESVPDIKHLDCVVIYLGCRGMESTLIEIEEMRKMSSTTRIIAVTCTCNLEVKRSRWERAITDGIIDKIVVTKECGGFQTMSDIIEFLIHDWPQEHPTSV